LALNLVIQSKSLPAIKEEYCAGIGILSKVQSGNVGLTASRYNSANTRTVTNYGQRVAAQFNNPNYNTNVLVYGLQQIVSSLQNVISSLQK
jgi:hypothetical protein